MPLCDAYIPTGALDPESERTFVARVTEILVEHEMRRIRDLDDDPEHIAANRERAMAIAWTFVHRTDTYVAGAPVELPHYRIVASIPEGQIDDRFAPAINRDILAALIDAEGGRHPHPERRLWVVAGEITDGLWGAGGRSLHLEQIVDFVAPGWGTVAVQRWQETQAQEAVALVRLAADQAPTA